jgi:hypothetical protein
VDGFARVDRGTATCSIGLTAWYARLGKISTSGFPPNFIELLFQLGQPLAQLRADFILLLLLHYLLQLIL